MQDHKFVFICGLHKSGTSVLAKSVAEHPMISGLTNTGVPQDEGQHVQTVYPTDRVHSKMGEFGFTPDSYMDETSPLVTEANRVKLFSEWEKYWDLEKPVLMEKSPPNLIRTRFLQAMFPNSYFVVVTRHPIAVSFALRKGWRINIQLHWLIKHWLVCYDKFNADKDHLSRVLTFRYEDFVKDPECYLEKIYSFIGLDHYPAGLKIRPGVNQKYFDRWMKFQDRPLFKPYVSYLMAQYEKRVNQYGYSLRDLELTDAAEL